MPDADVLHRMRADWNERASEDANYYVAFGRREQDDQEFFASGASVVETLTAELRRLRTRTSALEIGCGPGRLLRPLSRHFDEVHGVDVSDEMVRLAKERLRDVSNAHPHHGTGSDLALFPDARFDFVYSYAVFQHIPSREVVFSYLAEAARVLKPGGILKCQINGLPAHARQYDTWSGVRVAPDELRQFAREHDCALLALEGIWTQYLWMTARRMENGWTASLAGRQAAPSAGIRNISNTLTGEAVVPSRGQLAAMSLWMENLPPGCDLNHLEVTADGAPCRLIFLGEPEKDGVAQLNAALPPGIRSGLVRVEVKWLGQPVAPARWVRVLAAGPLVPRVLAVSDGINLLSGTRVVTGTVKATLEEVEHPDRFAATVGGRPACGIESFCTDPLAHRYEFNFGLPEGTAPGVYAVELSLGRRRFPAAGIEVAADGVTA
jgi:SAM-dependent methyltransferase